MRISDWSSDVCSSDLLGHADSIAELDSAALGKACGNDILGEITAYIRGGTVNLGRVLARKNAAAMRSRAAIGVDNDLATRQTSVAIRPANFEKARGIDVNILVRGHPALRKDVGHYYLGIIAQFLLHLGIAEGSAVLGD